jgi:signal peptidase I
MSYTNDDSREQPPAIEPPARPAGLPTPEPLVAAEPLPQASMAEAPPASMDVHGNPTQPGHPSASPEPSWREIVGAPWDRPRVTSPLESRETGAPRPVSDSSGEVPPSGGPPAAPLPADDTTVGTLGEEPMGGVPREEPAPPAAAPLAPGDAVQPLTPRQPAPPTITLGRVGEELFAWLKTLASAAVYATLIVTFGFQVARVEGQSMAPTLENQDRLIVNKLAYRLGDPQVGDIVMLYYPLNPEKSFVKRVIAEEGDQIRIVDGRVYRNDVPVNDDYVPPQYRSHDDYGPEVVPQGYYFVMGDHRNNSSDSRHWKFVPKKYIIGKVQLRWWPLPQARIF